jgi:hypothetical protein
LKFHCGVVIHIAWCAGPGRVVRESHGPEYGGHSPCRCWSGPLVSAVMRWLPGSRATDRLTLWARLLWPLSADGAGGPWQSWLWRGSVVPMLLRCECSRDWCLCQSESHVATDGHLVSQSWCRAPSGAHDQKLSTVWQLGYF